MNQDFFQNQESPILFDTPVKKNAKYYRATARARLTKIWGIVILVTFLAMLLGTVSESGGMSFNLELNLSEEQSTEEAPAEESTQLTEEQITVLVAALIFFVTVVVLGAIAFDLFVTSPVKVGYHRFLLEVADENADGIRTATLFSNFKKGAYFKTVRLNLLYSLIMLAAAIPSLVSIGIGGFMLATDYTVDELLSFNAAELIAELIAERSPIIAVFGIGSLISSVLQYFLSCVYGFAFFIMADCPSAGAIEALRSSRTLMRGNKWKLFCLDLSFIGWELLVNLFTCGIGMLFLAPYRYTSHALFYSDLAQRDKAKEFTFPSIDPDEGDTADAPKSPTAPTFTEEAPAENDNTTDGINPESLEKIEFPSLDLDDEKKDD